MKTFRFAIPEPPRTKAETMDQKKGINPPKLADLALSSIPSGLIFLGTQVFGKNIMEMTGLGFTIGLTAVFYVVMLVATFCTAKIKEKRGIESSGFPVVSNLVAGALLFGGLNLMIGYNTAQGLLWMFIFPIFLFTISGAVYGLIISSNKKQNQPEVATP
jgi:hypothetical protein